MKLTAANRLQVSRQTLKGLGVIARHLKSLEAISFGIGRAFDYTSCPTIKGADCFGIKLLAMTGQGNPVAGDCEFTS